MILVIDNYDSFTYNLVHYVGACGEEVVVKRNDEITLEGIQKLNPDKIIISPGPCTPNEAGISVELVKNTSVPLLGVCLGHQSIGSAFGAKIIKAPQIFHGKISQVEHSGKRIFKMIQALLWALSIFLSQFLEFSFIQNQLKLIMACS
jgi:anthranilate synthase/aminodeoxychorismate synthase-like glutamine amidotransferase